MEAFIGLLLVIGILGGGFLLLCAICFGIVFLLSFIKGSPNGDDWIWSPDIYKDEDKNKK